MLTPTCFRFDLKLFVSLLNLIKMTIKYYLQPNPITPDPNDQKARVQPNNTLNFDDIIARCVKRGTTLTETDLRAAVRLYLSETGDAVAEGNNVTLPLVNLRPSITGTFNDVNDSFDSSRHTVKASCSAGIDLVQKMQTASVEKITGTVLSPDIVDFTDVKTNNHTQASKGNIGVITGSQLKFNPANAAEGIFFVNVATNAETKVADIAQRTEGKLMFLIPTSLTAGTYYVEVRRAYTNANSIRSDAFEQNLTVA